MTLLLLLSLAGPAWTGSGASERAVRCRYECVCFREGGYRCFRHYTQTCSGRACWQCQAEVTRKARKSCNLGRPVKSCYCKFTKLPSRHLSPPRPPCWAPANWIRWTPRRW